MISKEQITLLFFVVYGVFLIVIAYFGYKLNAHIALISIIRSLRNRNTKKKTPLYTVIIIGPRSHDYYTSEGMGAKVKVKNGIISVEHNKETYSARQDQAYRNDYNLIEKIIQKRDREYILIFYEKKENEKETPQALRPPDINQKTEGDHQFITSNLLYRVWKYRGVKPAFRDEFKEPVSFNVPTWAIVIVVLVFVVVGIYLAYQSGALDLALQQFKGGATL